MRGSTAEDREPILVISTAPDMETAKEIARLLVVERLVACASLIPSVTSYYWWQEEVRADEEVMILMKTAWAKFKDLELRIKEIHPYDVPEILALPVKGVNKDYLGWLLSEVELG
jgi:periplasmic divalent cation tolerance protein